MYQNLAKHQNYRATLSIRSTYKLIIVNEAILYQLGTLKSDKNNHLCTYHSWELGQVKQWNCALQNYCFMPSRVETCRVLAMDVHICKNSYYCILSPVVMTRELVRREPIFCNPEISRGSTSGREWKRLCPHNKAEPIIVTLYGCEVRFNLMIQGIYGSWSFLPKLNFLRENIGSFLYRLFRWKGQYGN